MVRESFVFYRSWYEAIDNLPKESQLEVLKAILKYGLDGAVSDGNTPLTTAMLAMVKPQIDVNNKRYENGKRGGRPPKPNDNQTETKAEPNNNQTITKEKPKRNQNETKTKPNVTKAEPNVYVNDNVYVYVNDNANDNIKKEPSSNEEDKKEELSSHSSEKVDFIALMEFYNKTFNGILPTIKTMTAARKQAIKARVAQYGKHNVFEVLKKVYDSQFLRGSNPRNWKADFDWIFKQNNFTKIYEGRYDTEYIAGTSAARNTTDAKRESARNLKDLSAAILENALTEID